MARAKKKKPSEADSSAHAGLKSATALAEKADTRLAIQEAYFVSPSQMYLRFADGLKGAWTFADLSLDMANVKPTTIKASDSGVCVDVKSKWDEDVQPDSSSLRARVDKNYAKEVERTLDSLSRRIGL